MQIKSINARWHRGKISNTCDPKHTENRIGARTERTALTVLESPTAERIKDRKRKHSQRKREKCMTYDNVDLWKEFCPK